MDRKLWEAVQHLDSGAQWTSITAGSADSLGYGRHIELDHTADQSRRESSGDGALRFSSACEQIHHRIPNILMIVTGTQGPNTVKIPNPGRQGLSPLLTPVDAFPVFQSRGPYLTCQDGISRISVPMRAMRGFRAGIEEIITQTKTVCKPRYGTCVPECHAVRGRAAPGYGVP